MYRLVSVSIGGSVKNKPRWSHKLNGHVKMWVCSCGAPYCDPMYVDERTIASRKMRDRQYKHLCIGCGQETCKCKNPGRSGK